MDQCKPLSHYSLICHQHKIRINFLGCSFFCYWLLVLSASSVSGPKPMKLLSCVAIKQIQQIKTFVFFPLRRFSLYCLIILVMFPEIRGYLPISAVFVHILRFVAGFQLHRPCSPLTASKQTIKYVKTICTVQETEQRNHSGGAKYAARERRQEKQAVLIRREWDQCSSIRAKSNPLSP